MPKTIQTGAVQADADLCNAIDPPTQGCAAGGGIHVAIPGDWLTRIQAAQPVPGCTYHALLDDGHGVLSLVVSDAAIRSLGIPAIVNALPGPLKAQAALLNAKLASA
ncbi:MAG TPA: hypothetical protein VI195_06885 [Steroidobacteraceae bacterium]